MAFNMGSLRKSCGWGVNIRKDAFDNKRVACKAWHHDEKHQFKRYLVF